MFEPTNGTELQIFGSLKKNKRGGCGDTPPPFRGKQPTLLYHATHILSNIVDSMEFAALNCKIRLDFYPAQ